MLAYCYVLRLYHSELSLLFYIEIYCSIIYLIWSHLPERNKEIENGEVIALQISVLSATGDQN